MSSVEHAVTEAAKSPTTNGTSGRSRRRGARFIAAEHTRKMRAAPTPPIAETSFPMRVAPKEDGATRHVFLTP